MTPVAKGDDAARLRPTPDRVRESLFSMLHHQGVLEGARVLDLFAGTGALGFEALSRGADYVSFVENGRVGQRLIQENIKLLDVAGNAELLRVDATRLSKCTKPCFDLVFLDPPYGKSLGKKALGSALEFGWIGSKATIVWEENSQQTAPQGFVSSDCRRFGDTWVTLLEAI